MSVLVFLQKTGEELINKLLSEKKVEKKEAKLFEARLKAEIKQVERVFGATSQNERNMFLIDRLRQLIANYHPDVKVPCHVYRKFITDSNTSKSST